MAGFLEKIFGGGKVDYEKAKELARAEKPKTRKKLAERSDLAPEFLYFLADDPEVDVRVAIAGNEATPRQADLLLTGDQDPQVRSRLAEKISRLAPGLTANEQDKIRKMTYETLEVLARDQATRVRQVVADTLKDMTDAPNEIIQRLARDAEIVVSGPVLENSPLLNDDDLLEIIQSGPIKGALSAISKRESVTETISDAIHKADDIDAISVLLSNPSAQIREETLDKILEEAPEIKPWHGPLVRRPKLPQHAALKLAKFVADSLLEALSERKDLDQSTLQSVRAVVQQRLDPEKIKKADKNNKASGQDGAEPKAAEEKKPEKSEIEIMVEKVQKLHDESKLSEEDCKKALMEGERKFVIAALAVKTGFKYLDVEKVVRNRSAKGIVSLSWKGGFSPEFSVDLQKKLTHHGGKDVLKPKNGEYPMDVDDMEWQLEFLGGL